MVNQHYIDQAKKMADLFRGHLEKPCAKRLAVGIKSLPATLMYQRCFHIVNMAFQDVIIAFGMNFPVPPKDTYFGRPELKPNFIDYMTQSEDLPMQWNFGAVIDLIMVHLEKDVITFQEPKQTDLIKCLERRNVENGSTADDTRYGPPLLFDMNVNNLMSDNDEIQSKIETFQDQTFHSYTLLQIVGILLYGTSDPINDTSNIENSSSRPMHINGVVHAMLFTHDIQLTDAQLTDMGSSDPLQKTKTIGKEEDDSADDGGGSYTHHFTDMQIKASFAASKSAFQKGDFAKLRLADNAFEDLRHATASNTFQGNLRIREKSKSLVKMLQIRKDDLQEEYFMVSLFEEILSIGNDHNFEPIPFRTKAKYEDFDYTIWQQPKSEKFVKLSYTHQDFKLFLNLLHKTYTNKEYPYLPFSFVQIYPAGESLDGLHVFFQQVIVDVLIELYKELKPKHHSQERPIRFSITKFHKCLIEKLISLAGENPSHKDFLTKEHTRKSIENYARLRVGKPPKEKTPKTSTTELSTTTNPTKRKADSQNIDTIQPQIKKKPGKPKNDSDYDSDKEEEISEGSSD